MKRASWSLLRVVLTYALLAVVTLVVLLLARQVGFQSAEEDLALKALALAGAVTLATYLGPFFERVGRRGGEARVRRSPK